MTKSRIVRVASVVGSRWGRLVTRLTLGVGIILVSEGAHHHGATSSVWELGAAVGFGLIVLSLPVQGYDLYLRYRRNKLPPRGGRV